MSKNLFESIKWDTELTDSQKESLEKVSNGILKKSELVENDIKFTVQTIAGELSGSISKDDAFAHHLSNANVDKAVNLLSTSTNNGGMSKVGKGSFHNPFA